MYGIISCFIVIAIMTGRSDTSRFDFNHKDFFSGFDAFSLSLRFDILVVNLLVPLIVGLWIVSRKGLVQADSLMVLIMGILLTAPILATFTNITNQPYRFVPLVVFFAVGFGTLLSQKGSTINQNKTKVVSNVIFVATLSVVLANIISVIFPALV